MKAAASTVSSLGPLVDHVVIIVKENHAYDNYFGTFPNSEGDNKLGKAQNPPPSDPKCLTRIHIGRSTSHSLFPGHPRAAASCRSRLAFSSPPTLF
jgi:hypothetical protein